mmetsp:Transcript_32186/g.51567  ORF Transcript_32186/g.51567 Transcript_32186/m.51567 type:complete len:298 (-) Transcript_32186:338-1231(-)
MLALTPLREQSTYGRTSAEPFFSVAPQGLMTVTKSRSGTCCVPGSVPSSGCHSMTPFLSYLWISSSTASRLAAQLGKLGRWRFIFTSSVTANSTSLMSFRSLPAVPRACHALGLSLPPVALNHGFGSPATATSGASSTAPSGNPSFQVSLLSPPATSSRRPPGAVASWAACPGADRCLPNTRPPSLAAIDAYSCQRSVTAWAATSSRRAVSPSVAMSSLTRRTAITASNQASRVCIDVGAACSSNGTSAGAGGNAGNASRPFGGGRARRCCIATRTSSGTPRPPAGAPAPHTPSTSR